MRYACLACDFDGTLASDGVVSEEVLQALSRITDSGRRLVMVTGRRLDDLLGTFPQAHLFDYIVCENGAVLYKPSTKAIKLLAEPPVEDFERRLRQQGVVPLEVGRVVIASWHPNENKILDAIHDLQLDLHISFNKGAVMVLPPQVNKGSGLLAALRELGLSRHNVVCIGDAENDHVMFSICECGVAVGNALPSVKKQADLVMRGDHGHGVIELIDRIVRTDLSETAQFISRHSIPLGRSENDQELKFGAHNFRILIAGPSQSGKSTVSMSILERLAGAGYQYCVIDPEGEYDRAPRAVTIGNQHYVPSVEDVIRALENPNNNVVVSLLGINLSERPAFLVTLMAALQEMRRLKGRPHWTVIDEAHHMLHPYWDQTLDPQWHEPGAVVIITIDPKEISSKVLSGIDLVLAVGHHTGETFASFAGLVGHKAPEANGDMNCGEVMAWYRHQYDPPIRLTIRDAPVAHQRHLRKYASGNVGNERSFYFTGPNNQLNIRCQNLFLFMQIAEGLDDTTWFYHLRRGDYSSWFESVIRDKSLAKEVAAIETDAKLSASESKLRIKELIERRYAPPVQLVV